MPNAIRVIDTHSEFAAASLAWASSGHTGTAGYLAGFNGTGAAVVSSVYCDPTTKFVSMGESSGYRDQFGLTLTHSVSSTEPVAGALMIDSTVDGAVSSGNAIYGIWNTPNLKPKSGGDVILTVDNLYVNTVNGDVVQAFNNVISFAKAGANTIGTLYGIFINEPTQATINYPIYVVGGLSYFGGNVTSARTITGAHLKDTSLTSGRVALVTTGGQLADDAAHTYDSNYYQLEVDSACYFRAIAHSDTVGNYPYFRMDKSRGTGASKTSVAAGDVTGGVNFYGYQNSDYAATASFSSYVDSVVGNYNRGYLNFAVSDGTTAGANVDVFRTYYDRLRTYKFIQTDVYASGTINEGQRWCYPNAIGGGFAIDAYVGNSVTKTGQFIHGLDTGAKSYYSFSTFNGATLAEKVRITGDGNVGVGTTGPDAKLDVLSTTEQLRLTYTDGSVYTSFTVSSGGDLTIAPSGGDTSITGTLTATSDIKGGGYKSSDGTAGATADVAVAKVGGGTRTLSFKNGLYTGYTDS